MHLQPLPNDSPEARAHRERIHGGHKLGGLEVYATSDNHEPDQLTCRLCAWPKGTPAPADPELLDAIVATSAALRQRDQQ